MKKIAILPGDGIGPEVMDEALKILNAIQAKSETKFKMTMADVGGIAIDKHGKALPEETIKICKDSDAILFGSVGGPKWEKLPAEEQPERAALLPLRKIFGLYANLRPSIIFEELIDASPLRKNIITNNGSGLNIMIIRELTGGIYFGKKNSGTDFGMDEMKYTTEEIKRIAKIGFETAKVRDGKLTSIDKANVLTTMVHWRKIVTEVAVDYPEVKLNHMYVDNAAMQLASNPKQFDVMLCPNMFGDILSDLGGAITGSLGMLPSASLGESGFGLYEPSGGSAPDIAGKGIANPIAQILSLAMLLKYSFKMDKESKIIEDAVKKVLKKYRTKDIMKDGKVEVTTSQMGDEICKIIEKA